MPVDMTAVLDLRTDHAYAINKEMIIAWMNVIVGSTKRVSTVRTSSVGSGVYFSIRG